LTDGFKSFAIYFTARQIGANKIKNNRKLGAQGAVTAKPADKRRILAPRIALNFSRSFNLARSNFAAAF
jgi:hypothetical protein